MKKNGMKNNDKPEKHVLSFHWLTIRTTIGTTKIRVDQIKKSSLEKIDFKVF